MSQFYAKGTIKVKNVDGVLEPFLPRTDVSCISDSDSMSLTQKITNLETQVTEAENSGGIEIMYIEPDSTNTADFSNETMIGYIVMDKFVYTVDTTKISSSNKKTSIPFNLYNRDDTSIMVDWGDGTNSIYTKSNFPNSSTLNSNSSAGISLMHTYSTPGEYVVKIYSDEYNNISLYSLYYTGLITDSPLYYFKKTVTQINSPLPPLSSQMDFYGCFEDCSALTSIPSNLFSNNPQMRSIIHLFSKCTSLTSLPAGLFDNCTSITEFTSCFYNCSSLTSIPSGLFDDCTAVTTFNTCFRECTSLTSIPSGLFDNCTAVTNFSSCFWKCTSLTTIPEHLFDNCTAVTNFEGCFYNCTSLVNVPRELFKYNNAVTSYGNGSSGLGGCFERCTSLTYTIPLNSKSGSSSVGFNYCFYYCTSLTYIDPETFSNAKYCRYMNYCFANCTSLTSIPSGLFDNLGISQSTTYGTNFTACFSGCSSLTTIPAGLFDNCTSAKSFEYCFRNCTSLTTIPTDLFRYNTNASSFGYCFNGCTALTTIPTDLFRYYSPAKSFNNCFSECTALNDFTIYIRSALVSDAGSFVTNKAGTTRTVYVLSGSTTKTTFNNVASSLGLTIIDYTP